MAQSKKKVAVLKKTVSIRTYNELKSKYAALNVENTELLLRNNKQANQITELCKELDGYRNKCNTEAQPKAMSASVSSITNQEFIVLDNIVNQVAALNPFQRRTVVAGFLSSIIERMKAELRSRSNAEFRSEKEHDTCYKELQQQETGIAEMDAIIGSFSNS